MHQWQQPRSLQLRWIDSECNLPFPIIKSSRQSCVPNASDTCHCYTLSMLCLCIVWFYHVSWPYSILSTRGWTSAPRNELPTAFTHISKTFPFSCCGSLVVGTLVLITNNSCYFSFSQLLCLWLDEVKQKYKQNKTKNSSNSSIKQQQQ